MAPGFLSNLIHHPATCQLNEWTNTMASFRYKTLGYAAPSAGARLQPFSFERRALRANDVAMEILYAGVCHSDLHWARND
jgi:alcohol dehydrogenase (NADP+)